MGGDPTGTEKAHDLGFERLVFFSDAVFAIAITLLVLDLKLQTGPHGEILIAALIPKLLGFVVSFSVTSFYWLAHHRLFKTLRAESAALRGVNLVFLASVVFLAFPTSVVSEHVAVPWAVIFYAASVSATGLLLAALVLVARRAPLMRPGETRARTLNLVMRALGAPVVFITSCALAFTAPLAAMLLWMLTPVSIRALGWLGARLGQRLDAHQTVPPSPAMPSASDVAD